MTAQTKTGARAALVVLIVVLAFFASYRIAVALSGPQRAAASPLPAASGSFKSACACCGGSAGSGQTTEGSATLEGGVQRITVDTSSGSYNPNVIKLKAGVPAEITFTQASGCLGQVQSKDFGFFEDLTTGDKTVRIPADALTPGTYGFECGMSMVFGTIIVE